MFECPGADGCLDSPGVDGCLDSPGVDGCLDSRESMGVWIPEHRPGLFIVGYFVVEMAGMATDFDQRTLQSGFGQNFHVRYPSVFKIQREQLVLVKGGRGSRVLKKAHRISSEAIDRSGKPLKVLSPEMQKVFGGFDGKVSIQRSPPRWVDSAFVDKAIKFVRKLT
jgi:hypothetical protein